MTAPVADAVVRQKLATRAGLDFKRHCQKKKRSYKDWYTNRLSICVFINIFQGLYHQYEVTRGRSHPLLRMHTSSGSHGHAPWSRGLRRPTSDIGRRIRAKTKAANPSATPRVSSR